MNEPPGISTESLDITSQPMTIITDREFHRCRKWRVSRERTTVDGVATAIILLRTGKFNDIEELALAMKLTVPQTRWRLSKGRDRGQIANKFYKSFGAPK